MPLTETQRVVLTTMVQSLAKLQKPCRESADYMHSIGQLRLAFLTHMVCEAITDVRTEYLKAMTKEPSNDD